MRLKEDSDNWRSRAIIRRDFKHDHSESPPKFISRKNTQEWCRGRAGTEHVTEWHKEFGFFGDEYLAATCERCGKQLFRRA